MSLVPSERIEVNGLESIIAIKNNQDQCNIFSLYIILILILLLLLVLFLHSYCCYPFISLPSASASEACKILPP